MSPEQDVKLLRPEQDVKLLHALQPLADAARHPDRANTAWRRVPRARARTSGRWLIPARLNGVPRPLLLPAKPPYAFRHMPLS